MIRACIKWLVVGVLGYLIIGSAVNSIYLRLMPAARQAATRPVTAPRWYVVTPRATVRRVPRVSPKATEPEETTAQVQAEMPQEPARTQAAVIAPEPSYPTSQARTPQPAQKQNRVQRTIVSSGISVVRATLRHKSGTDAEVADSALSGIQTATRGY
jgi:hypothetical protein